MKKLILMFIMGMAITFVNAQGNKTVVKTADLQKAITENITKDYPNFKVIDAYKIDNKSAISYEVQVEKGTIKENLYYDKDGKFIRKENATKSTSKTTTTPIKTTIKSGTPQK